MASNDEIPDHTKKLTDAAEASKPDYSRLNPLLILRRLAEMFLREKKISPPKKHQALSSKEAQYIIHELEVHQIELEMQNDQLRQTQVALESARARYFDLYDLAPVGYCTINEKGFILEANLTAANLLGTNPILVPNQPFSNFILPEDQDIFYLLCKQLFVKGEEQAVELRLIHQDGTSFWVNLGSTIGLNENGMTVGRIVLSNITKRKLAEDAFQKIHRQNQAILDSITDAFIVLSEDMIITYFNAAAEQILNRKHIEVIGRNLFDVFTEGKGSIFEDNCSEAIRTQSPKSLDFKLNVASNQTWYGVRVYPSFDGITISLRVITERKKVESERANRQLIKQQLQKAESLERMAGAIAHIFNNHFQVALGNLEMGLKSFDGNEVLRKYLINAIQANRRASDVSGLLLTYLGQNVSKVEPLDLSEICKNSLPSIEAGVPSGINLETKLMSPGPIVHANASQLRQVLTILINNAWEAISAQTGEVTVVIKPVPVSQIPNLHVSHIDWKTTFEMFACLEVEDTGSGISDDNIHTIFDPFYTTKFTGRGLGLAVAMSLVKAWGGMIHVNSAANTGSCFKVFLPIVVDVVPQQAALLTAEETCKATGTVLLVDDDPVICEVVQIALEQLGFTVIVAGGGHEAVTLFQEHHNRIDCLLTDLSMPDMDGWETLAALRKIKPHLPSILTSGYDEAHAMSGDHKELPQAFLHKPFSTADLENALNRILTEATREAVTEQ